MTGMPRTAAGASATVGSYCTASLSRTAAPSDRASAMPSPRSSGGLSENAYLPHQPPVAKTTVLATSEA